MRAWIKGVIIGAFLGFIWSIIGMIVEIPYENFVWVEYIIGFPIYIAGKLGFGFVLGFIGAPLVGIVLGALIGFLYELYRGRSLNKEGKIQCLEVGK